MSSRIAVSKIIQLSIPNCNALVCTPCHSSLFCVIDSSYLPFVNYKTSEHIRPAGDLHESLFVHRCHGAKVSGSPHGKACMEEHTVVPVLLVDFECIDLAISFLVFVRFGRYFE